MLTDLWTEAGKALSGLPWNVYPRPQLAREEWLNLNGSWEFSSAPESDASLRSILVPFCPESLLSGIHETYPAGARLEYRRSFVVPESWSGKRVILHFGAVDQIAEVFVNGVSLGRHVGGYLPFSFDITDSTLAPGRENALRVSVRDPLSHALPWGKQKKDRGGMWYTPVSGIWQSVWLEPVPQDHVRALRIETGASSVTIHADGVSEGVVTLGGVDYPLENGSVTIRLPEAHLWSPEDPYLYFFTLRAGADLVRSYFALRTLTVQTLHGKPRLCLNGKPYFFHGLLDQGYWSDGLYTPASPAAFEQDILSMKALGFNTLRKHIKIEPEAFYYACDHLGMIVFQDMVNNGDYSFLRDTALPTAGLLRLPDRHLHPDPAACRFFLEHMEQTVRQLSNHPCICSWTIFNEGWGQFCADEAYRRLRSVDSSRWIDATSGWFRQKESDVESLHIYFKPLHLGKLPLPQVLSEYGGYACKIPGHSANAHQTYGYKKFSSTADFSSAFRTLLQEELLPLAEQGLCAAIFTQVSDVEDETNGLLTYDRALCKISPEDFAPLARQLQEAVMK